MRKIKRKMRSIAKKILLWTYGIEHGSWRIYFIPKKTGQVFIVTPSSFKKYKNQKHFFKNWARPIYNYLKSKELTQNNNDGRYSCK